MAITIPSPLQFTVSGFIYDMYDSPIPGVTVIAYDKDLRTEQLLGEVVSDAKGIYKIEYSSKPDSIGEYKTRDIFIRVFSSNNQLLGHSSPLFVPSRNIG